jgi:uncharacterized protein YqfB (UPF0267 family)
VKIISFAWTSPALISGHKTVTRRDWDDSYARRFSAGELVAAYNRSQRQRGQQIATIRLTAAPACEPMSAMPDSDYEAEGFGWFEAHPAALPPTHLPSTLREFDAWKRNGGSQWVIRFELVSIEPMLPPDLERWAKRGVMA